MAVARTARIIASAPAGERGRLLRLELPEGGELGFTGGQYVIIDTGVPRDDGKRHKRAYSVISPDTEQHTFSIVVYGLQGGPGSAALHRAEVGTELAFSGPWGSFLPDDSVLRRTLLVATDSGITATLGLLRGRAFAPQRAQVQLVWLSESPGAFLSPDAVQEEVRSHGGRFAHHCIPPPGHPERPDAVRLRVLEVARAQAPERVFLAGDGALLHPLREALLTCGVETSAIRLEAFFNNPARKAPA